jgi:2-dehydro-3-deoxyphosphogluconate aldolase/(4S)-4-hydroxy-2-oxoglutarate aldolase
LVETGLMAILRDGDASGFAAASRTLVEAGVTCLEYTLTTPRCLDALRTARDQLPDSVALGVGTVTTLADVRDAREAGAEFVVMPHTDPEVIAAAVSYRLPCYPGALTPTEVLTAWRAGATAVKVFPAGLGGPAYLRHLRGPLPQVPLLPTGGVGIENIPEYVRAGAVGVGLGGPLFGKAPIGEDLPALADRARRALRAVADTRAGAV